jgi:excisionase family DNA binding protein
MKLLTRKEAAEFLRISLRKLDELASEGEIPYSKMGKGIRSRVVFKLQDLENYVDRQRVDITAAVNAERSILLRSG